MGKSQLASLQKHLTKSTSSKLNIVRKVKFWHYSWKILNHFQLQTNNADNIECRALSPKKVRTNYITLSKLADKHTLLLICSHCLLQKKRALPFWRRWKTTSDCCSGLFPSPPSHYKSFPIHMEVSIGAIWFSTKMPSLPKLLPNLGFTFK